MMKWFGLTFLLIVMLFFGSIVYTYSAEVSPLDVDVDLVLLVDISGSIDQDEFVLEQKGISDAFKTKEIIDGIKAGSLGRIAVSIIEFAGEANVIVDRTVIDSEASSFKFADTFMNTTRFDVKTSDGTCLTRGIDGSITQLQTSPFRATRKVIDVSGDGRENCYSDDISTGAFVVLRQTATKEKIIINGLAILSDESNVDEYYKDHVIIGRGSFVSVAKTMNDFALAIRRKLIREIG